jgi:hypothetical protein
MRAAPATIRHEKAKRAAKRAALAGLHLDPAQLKLTIAEHDALGKKSAALFAEHTKVFDAAPPLEIGPPNPVIDRAYTHAIRRLDQLHKQWTDIDVRAKKLRDHPQIKAVILAREKQEERG